MGDHLVLYVDRLITASSFASASNPLPSNCTNNLPVDSSSFSYSISSSSLVEKQQKKKKKNDHLKEETETEFVECRICHEEDVNKSMEIPCACSGSMKYAHRNCVQRWCNEKGDTTCEICQETYKPGYSVPQHSLSNGIPVNISRSWQFNDPRVIAVATTEHHLVEAGHDDFREANINCATCCRSILLIMMVLLLLRHAFVFSTAAEDEDFSTFFTIFLLRAAGFILPCYIMARAMSVIQCRRL